jgi:hypothetical protein
VFDAIGEVAEDTSNLVIMMFLILVAKGYTVRAKEQPSVLLRPNRPPHRHSLVTSHPLAYDAR